jgi:zeta-carotene desaturase
VNPDAIVIGAGFAGLSAATALAERGSRVLVLEARPTLGGRATAFTDPVTGDRVDNGQHVMFGCYHETFRFLRRIGTESDVLVQPHLSIDSIDRDGRRSRLKCPALPSPFHLLAGLMTWSALGWRDRVAVLRLRRAISDLMRSEKVRSSGSPGSVPVASSMAARSGSSCPSAASNNPVRFGEEPGSPETETVRKWLVEHGQTPRLIELLWEPLAVAGLNQSVDVAAAATFLAVLARVFGSDPRSASLVLPLKPLDELYALPARDYIERSGGAVETGAVACIDISGNAPTVTVGDRRLRAPTVICAAPWYALGNVFAGHHAPLAAVLDAAAHTDASPIVTVNLWFDRVVTDQMLVGLPGRTMQWVFDKRTVFGERASHLSLVSSGAASVVGWSNRELIDLALKEVRGALPPARAAAMTRGVVVREKRATFSVAPGQPPRPSVETAVPGLFLAGDWTDTGLPATIEGAVESGHRAANAALPVESPPT